MMYAMLADLGAGSADVETSALKGLAATGVVGAGLVIALFVIRTLYTTSRDDAKTCAAQLLAAGLREKELLGQLDTMRTAHSAEMSHLRLQFAGEIATQRGQCALEKEEISSAYEAKCRQFADEYAKELGAMNAEARTREDVLRREMIALVKETEAARDRVSDKLASVLEKIASKVLPQ